MEFEDLKKELLKDKSFRREYFKKDLSFAIGQMVIEARVKKGLTQAQLAKIVGTKQPGIARLENGNNLPSLSFLEKIAKKLGSYLIPPRFAFLENMEGFMYQSEEKPSQDVSTATRYTINDIIPGPRSDIPQQMEYFKIHE